MERKPKSPQYFKDQAVYLRTQIKQLKTQNADLKRVLKKQREINHGLRAGIKQLKQSADKNIDYPNQNL